MRLRLEIRRKDGRDLLSVEIVRMLYWCVQDTLGGTLHSVTECREMDPEDLNSWGTASRYVVAEISLPDGTDIGDLQDSEDPDAHSIRIL